MRDHFEVYLTEIENW